MTELVAADIGGTHARFALARIGQDGEITIGAPLRLATSDYPGIEQAFAAFCRGLNRPAPRAGAIALAAPIDPGRPVRLTNNSWVIDPARLGAALGLDQVVVLNDFAAVAHAVMRAGGDDLLPVCGPDPRGADAGGADAGGEHRGGNHRGGNRGYPPSPLAGDGTISVIGPGTGLGVAQIHQIRGVIHVQPTEGGHIGFAPHDALDDRILAVLRGRHGRVSAERVVSGPGIVAIYQAICQQAGSAPALISDRAIWQAALAGNDRLAQAALDRFCLCLGRVAGDLALAHGARAVVLAGGLGDRLRAILARSAFARGFAEKGRYCDMMASLPVSLLTLPEPGLIGAAAALADEFGERC